MLKQMLLGAAAGTAATIPMTFAMEAMHRALPGEPPTPLPPREVAEGGARQAGVDRHLSEEEMQNLTLAAHFGFGAAAGAVLGTFAPRSTGRAVLCGVGWGLTVWSSSYLGLLPALGVRHSAKHDPAPRTALMIAAHIVWGAAAGAIVGLASPAAGGRESTQAL